MKKVSMSMIAIASLLCAEGAAPASFTDALTMGKVTGESRTFYIQRTITTATDEWTRDALTTGGHVGYDSAAFNGLSFGVRFYGVYGFNINDAEATSGELAYADMIKQYDPSLYGYKNGRLDNYLFLGEAYLNYTFGNTNIKLGRQKLDTPMAGSDDARMLPNLFEAVVVSNTDIADTTLIAAHVTKITVGTFGNVYGETGSYLSAHSGYGYNFSAASSGEFVDMGEVALPAGSPSTDGVTAVAAIYKGIPDLTLQAWDYYAHDIVNVIYLQGDYGWNCLINDAVKMKASAQFINESDVGDALAGSIDSTYWGVQLAATYGGLTLTAAYSQTDDGEDDGNYGILSPWGGMPAFTQGMVTRHQFFTDTTATKVAATYNFADYNVKATGYYTEFEVGALSGYAADTTTKEAGFDIIYQATDKLQYRLRGNFPTDFKQDVDWAEYRFIVNYKF